MSDRRAKLANFNKAMDRLREGSLKMDVLDDLARDGLIQRFEFTFELAWKTAKDYLEAQGFSVKSPRQTIQLAFQTELIANGHVWIDALEKRNLMAHTYDENTIQVAEQLIRGSYYSMLKALQEELDKLL